MSVLKAIHPDMQPIMPSPGGRATPCSVGYRNVGGRFVMPISLSKQTAALLGFNVTDTKASNYAEVGFDERTGTLVVVNVSDPDLPTNDAIRWKAQLRQGTIVLMVKPHWLPDSYKETHSAERCEFKLMSDDVSLGSKGGRLVHYIEITVPAWAAPRRTQAAVTTRVIAPAEMAGQLRTRMLDTMPHTRPGPGRLP